MQKCYDITIIGGGLVGCALAIALRSSKWRVALIEANTPPALLNQSHHDMRSLALAYASQTILEKLNLWHNFAHSATPIKRIHISQQKHFGTTLLDAEKLGLSHFGQVIPLPLLFHELQQQLQEVNNLTLFRPAKVTALTSSETGWQLHIDDVGKIQSSLVIVADGDKSHIRQLLKLKTTVTNYKQTAIATNAAISLPHQHTAYERFTAQGSMAILPLMNQRAGLVCITDHDNAEQLQTFSDTEFLSYTQRVFGYRLGKFSDLGKRQYHKLQEVIATEQMLPGLLLLGNAAHTLHPIAAQGFNLGLRDINDLAQILCEITDINDKTILDSYLKQRQRDQHNTANFSNQLVNIFKPKIFPFSTARSLALQLFDFLPPAQLAFCLRRMGLGS